MHSRATYFDTPERTHPSVLRIEAAALASDGVLAQLAAGIGLPAVFVNNEREIVYANDLFCGLSSRAGTALIGSRIGEALGCIRATDPPNGCGTTPACEWCGAAQALRDARRDRVPVSKECRIVGSDEISTGTMNFRVTCTPLLIGDVPVVMIVFKDSSDSRRRQALERIFFHDALNAAGGLRGLMSIWEHLPADEANVMAPAAARLATQLVDELESYRDLLAAEQGTLPVVQAPIQPARVLDDVRTLYVAHDVGVGRTIALDVDDAAPTVHSDVVLLRRILGNLVKNALEASRVGEVVTMRHRDEGDRARFSVHNPAIMPDSARFQVFQRSFSTKGRGRGLGTYGSKLIAEQFLGGRLGFDVTADGTTFTLTLPHVA